ncbi:hypothetical protein A2911_01140 [Candidatus Nomurabacteria bacterium RIFCSPLOWO2_01_FULL_40_15]|uniref:Uncharacterized protein n=1 Tax=Candidatus Nomurabacteria bacterium RIFCSPLOWO2_01_FULL_40_15 TaxID=1801772 RepID=A0A1F6X843_9BACT|nr:MAG: hypothetical protein A2911_01140 [Candidatus Nomurabacteria bacterium RIFCSPLOWO2_01_FULL_40_15]
MKTIYLIGLFGLSSILSALALYQSNTYGWLIYAPGVIYSIALNVYLFIEHRISFVKIILLIIFSTIAWFLAYWSANFLISTYGLISGLLGAYIIATTIQGMGLLKNRAATMVIGMLAGVPSFFIFFNNGNFCGAGSGLFSCHSEWLFEPAILAFMVWQIPVGITIYLSSKSQKTRDISRI